MTSRRQDAEAKFAAAATRDTDRSLSRRNLLLAGTTFAAGSAMASALTTSTAQAQQQPAPAAGRQPNILVIWGDDIGTWNISHNNRGMMGYMTPNIDRIAKEGVVVHRLLRPAKLHRRPRRVHRRQRAGAHRHDQGRPARRQGGLAEDGRDHRHGDEEPRLRDRPVRQKPPGRPRRTPADACTASTSSSATSITSTPRRSPRTGTTRRTRNFQGKTSGDSARAACSSARPTRDGTQTIEDTGPLTKKRMETSGRGDHRRRQGFHQAAARGRQAVLLLVERHADAFPHPRQGGARGPLRAERR